MEHDIAVPAAAPGASATSTRPRGSDDVWRVLANIRVLVAIVAATEAMSLPVATRQPHPPAAAHAALHRHTHAWPEQCVALNRGQWWQCLGGA